MSVRHDKTKIKKRVSDKKKFVNNFCKNFQLMFCSLFSFNLNNVFVFKLKKVKATFIKSIRTSNTRNYFKMNNKQCEVGKDI